MAKYRISNVAESDIEDVLLWTHENFGEAARIRYEALLVQAILDIAEDPDRAGCHLRPEVGKSIRTYHLHYSRNAVSKSVGRVKRPRHFLLFRMAADDAVELGRVLHDSMDLTRHLSRDFE